MLRMRKFDSVDTLLSVHYICFERFFALLGLALNSQVSNNQPEF